MIVACDASGCVRGIVRHENGWSDPCRICGGAGGFSLGKLCKLLDEYDSTMSRFLDPHGRTRSRTAARILDKLLKVVR
jgi:hypothetical protein